MLELTEETSPLPKATVLFVDDERNILSALNRLFRPEGYRIFTADNGAAGLQILEREKIDLVISDMRMPHMDGAQFLGHVVQRWPDVVRLLLTGYSDIQSTVSAINKGQIYRYITKPWEDADIKLVVRNALEQKWLHEEKSRLEALTKQQNLELHELNLNLENKVAERTRELNAAHESLVRSFGSSIQIFSSVIELREAGVARGHARRIADQSRTLALHMGLSEQVAQDVFYAGLLHDIGKLGFGDALVNKPVEGLTLKEREEYIKHPVVGGAILMEMDPLQGAVPIIRSHHELWDGSGFPDGLHETDIPVGARILSVVNDYDDLQLGLLTKQVNSPVQARAYLERFKRRRYDPAVVDAFLSMPLDGAAGSGLARILSATQLEPGMVLSRDLLTPDGMLLLARGAVITDRIIGTVCRLESSLAHHFSIHVQPAA